MKKIFTAGLLCFSMWAHAAPLNKIVVFGDSLSDTGNLYEYMKHQLPISPPYFNGRFSNGPLWIELLAQSYYPNGDSKAHLLNYAFGGAGVSDDVDDDMDAEALFNLRREMDSYLLSHQDKADPDSLFVVWMGSNNYLGVPDDAESAVNEVISGLKHSLETLVEKGAKHIVLINIPNLGQTPAARDFDAVNELTYISRLHNEQMVGLKEELASAYPLVQWVLFDVNEVFKEMLNNPKKYGFHNTSDTCYEELISQPSSQSVLKMAATIKPKASLQKDVCNGYLFFDPVHPTFPAHQLMAKMMQDAFSAENIELK